MIPLAARTFLDRWPLFVGTIAAVAIGVGIVHAGMTIILGVENAVPPVDATPKAAEAFRQAASGANALTGMTVMLGASSLSSSWHRRSALLSTSDDTTSQHCASRVSPPVRSAACYLEKPH